VPFDFQEALGIDAFFVPLASQPSSKAFEPPSGKQIQMEKGLDRVKKERMSVPVQTPEGQQGAQANNMTLGAQQSIAPVQGGIPSTGVNQRSFQIENQLRAVRNRVAGLRQKAAEARIMGQSTSEGRESRKRKLNLSPGRSARRS